jgi:hypothetical protein
MRRGKRAMEAAYSACASPTAGGSAHPREHLLLVQLKQARIVLPNVHANADSHPGRNNFSLKKLREQCRINYKINHSTTVKNGILGLWMCEVDGNGSNSDRKNEKVRPPAPGPLRAAHACLNSVSRSQYISRQRDLHSSTLVSLQRKLGCKTRCDLDNHTANLYAAPHAHVHNLDVLGGLKECERRI